MIRSILAAAAAILLAGAAAAEDLGPPIGATIPHDLALPDASGKESGFSTLAGENGAAIFFVRSLDWCPYCKKQAVDISARTDDFAARGLRVVFVSYDAPEKQASFAEKNDFKPALLSDSSSAAIKAFGLLNTGMKEGSRYYGIPHPAVFIVDRNGVVQAKFYEDDFLTNDKSYRERPAADTILEGVDAWLAAATGQ